MLGAKRLAKSSHGSGGTTQVTSEYCAKYAVDCDGAPQPIRTAHDLWRKISFVSPLGHHFQYLDAQICTASIWLQDRAAKNKFCAVHGIPHMPDLEVSQKDKFLITSLPYTNYFADWMS